jgi:hypothetical protein
MKTAIKNANGTTIGYQVERGSQVIAEDASGAVIGRYDANTKKTFDKAGKPVYSGNMTAALICGGK